MNRKSKSLQKMMALTLGLLMGSLLSAYAQNPVSAADASKFIGKQVTVCDKVFSSRALRTLTILNLGDVFPNQHLNLVILMKDLPKFPIPADRFYLNKKISVTGVIEKFDNRLQIQLTDPAQLKIM